MFTGIIHHQGIVRSATKKKDRARFSFLIKGKIPANRPLRLGQSIAVNGVCLTAAKVGKQIFEADVIAQTLKVTSLGQLQPGSVVNLERSLRHGDEFGGHFVTGHVDACEKIREVKRQGKNKTFQINLPEVLKPYIAKKGSIAVDGISLTVQKVHKQYFEVGIIPHTLKVTNLLHAQKGDRVNLEIDLVARYLKTFRDFLPLKKSSKLSITQLKKQGF